MSGKKGLILLFFNPIIIRCLRFVQGLLGCLGCLRRGLRRREGTEKVKVG